MKTIMRMADEARTGLILLCVNQNLNYLYKMKMHMKNLIPMLVCTAAFISACDSKSAYYDSMTDFAFETEEHVFGANHYGEEYHHKFFADGTGLYLLKSWHDESECGGDCDLTAHSDTATFQYEVHGNAIIFRGGDIITGSGDADTLYVSMQDSIISMRREHEDCEDVYEPVIVKKESIDWNKVKSMLCITNM